MLRNSSHYYAREGNISWFSVRCGVIPESPLLYIYRLYIDGLGHKPSNSEFKKKKKFHKMTRDQVIHHV